MTEPGLDVLLGEVQAMHAELRMVRAITYALVLNANAETRAELRNRIGKAAQTYEPILTTSNNNSTAAKQGFTKLALSLSELLADLDGVSPP